MMKCNFISIKASHSSGKGMFSAFIHTYMIDGWDERMKRMWKEWGCIWGTK